MKVSDQNVSYLNPCGQTFYVSGDTLDQINIEVDELESSGPTLDQRERKMSTQKARRCLKPSLTLS